MILSEVWETVMLLEKKVWRTRESAIYYDEGI
jgi:hypothetical protein